MSKRYIFCKHCNERIDIPEGNITDMKEIECDECSYVNDLLYDFEITLFNEERNSVLYESIKDDLRKAYNLIFRIKRKNDGMGEFSKALDQQLDLALEELYIAQKLAFIKKTNYLLEERKKLC